MKKIIFALLIFALFIMPVYADVYEDIQQSHDIWIWTKTGKLISSTSGPKHIRLASLTKLSTIEHMQSYIPENEIFVVGKTTDYNYTKLNVGDKFNTEYAYKALLYKSCNTVAENIFTKPATTVLGDSYINYSGLPLEDQYGYNILENTSTPQALLKAAMKLESLLTNIAEEKDYGKELPTYKKYINKIPNFKWAKTGYTYTSGANVFISTSDYYILVSGGKSHLENIDFINSNLSEIKRDLNNEMKYFKFTNFWNESPEYFQFNSYSEAQRFLDDTTDLLNILYSYKNSKKVLIKPFKHNLQLWAINSHYFDLDSNILNHDILLQEIEYNDSISFKKPVVMDQIERMYAFINTITANKTTYFRDMGYVENKPINTTALISDYNKTTLKLSDNLSIKDCYYDVLLNLNQDFSSKNSYTKQNNAYISSSLGYSYYLNELLRHNGFESKIVQGYTSINESNQLFWVKVKVDGDYYFLDPFYDDLPHLNTYDKLKTKQLNYFLLDKEEMILKGRHWIDFKL